MKHISFLAVCLCFGITTSSCTFIKKTLGLVAEQPKVRVVSVDIKTMSMKQLDLDVTLEIDNPNRFDVSFSKVNYEVAFNGTQVADGFVTHEVSFPSQKKTEATLPLQITTDKALGILAQSLILKSALEMSWKGSADFKSPVGDITVEFHDEKRLM